MTVWHDYKIWVQIIQDTNNDKTARSFRELPQFVRTVQKQTLWQIKLNFKQHTDFAFLVESVLF